MSAYQPSSLLVGKKGAMTGPVTSSSLSSLTWMINDLERNHRIFALSGADCYNSFYLYIHRFAALQAFLLENLISQLNVGVAITEPAAPGLRLCCSIIRQSNLATSAICESFMLSNLFLSSSSSSMMSKTLSTPCNTLIVLLRKTQTAKGKIPFQRICQSAPW